MGNTASIPFGACTGTSFALTGKRGKGNFLGIICGNQKIIVTLWCECVGRHIGYIDKQRKLRNPEEWVSG